MSGRRNILKRDLNGVKFDCIARFMIVAAEKKRLVEYSEINKIFGIPLEDIRDYAGFLGDYCREKGLPYLNSLIINTINGMPGDDFFTWAGDTKTKDKWGEYVAECFSHFNLPVGNKVRFKNTSGLSDKIKIFLATE